MKIDHLTTEQTNSASVAIDTLSSLEIVQLMNAEDRKIADAVAAVAENIAIAVDKIAEQMRLGGRLFYIGAGTSGRLGVLDASECPPTFNTDPSQVVGIIAGGDRALRTAIEGAEDDLNGAERDLATYQFSNKDVLVGIASSGRTPYVIGGLRYAQRLGAFAVGFTCNPTSDLETCSDLVIAPVVGPEVISGSTRVLLGKTYGNWMVDLRATNIKLKARSIRIVSALAELSEPEAIAALERCDGEVKVAIVAARRNLSATHSRELLRTAGGKLRVALEMKL